MKQAAELAADEINATGGINGKRLELVVRDDYSDPDSAVFVAGDLYDSGVSAVVGHLFSGMTLAAAPVYNGGDDPVVAISPSSSSPDVTAAGAYTFRVCPSDLAHGTGARPLGARPTSPHPRRRALPQRRVRPRHSPDVRGRVSSGWAASSRRSTPISASARTWARISTGWRKAARPEFIVVAGNRSEAEEMLRQARKRGLTMPVLGGDGLEGIQEAGALAEGVYLSSPYFPVDPERAQPPLRRGVPPQVSGRRAPNQPAAATYDAIYLLRDVIARVGPGRAAVRRALAGVGSVTPPFEGSPARSRSTRNGDVPNQNVYIGLVRRGAVEVVDGADEPAGTQ